MDSDGWDFESPEELSDGWGFEEPTEVAAEDEVDKETDMRLLTSVQMLANLLFVAAMQNTGKRGRWKQRADKSEDTMSLVHIETMLARAYEGETVDLGDIAAALDAQAGTDCPLLHTTASVLWDTHCIQSP